jgi:hypothetical protein
MPQLGKYIFAAIGVLTMLASSAGVASVDPYDSARFDESSEIAAANYPGAQIIQNAVSIYVSEHGQHYLNTDFLDVLNRSGYGIPDEDTIKNAKYEAQNAFDLDHLPAKYERFQPVLNKIRDLFRKKLLSGLQLNDPRFKVLLPKIHYRVEFQHVGIHLDQEATRDLGRGGGVILVLNIVVSTLQVDIPEVTGQDLNNSFLKKFGVDDFHAGLAPESEPLTINVPFLVRATERGDLSVRAQTPETNLSKIAIESRFKRPLRLPKIAVLINDETKITLNQDELENELIASKREWMPSLQSFLEESLEAEAPAAINQFIDKNIKGTLATVNETSALGAESMKNQSKLKFAIFPVNVAANDQHLMIQLSGFVEDPSATKPRPFPGKLAALGPPRIESNKKYDVAIAVNQGLVNRMLQHSFYRGYFRDVPSTCDPSIRVELKNPPQFHFDQSKGPSYAKLHIEFETAPPWYSLLLLKSKIRLAMDLDLKIANTADKGARLLIEQFNEDSVKFDRNSIRLFARWGFPADWLKGKVIDKIHGLNTDPNCQYSPLVDSLPLPEAVYGMPITVQEIQAEQNGNLVLYLEYGVKHED